jgi:hypothetical protein
MDNWESRRKYFHEKEKPKIDGKLSKRIVDLLARGYMRSDLQGPLEELEDVEFRRVYGLGITTLAEIRKVIPVPDKV